MKIQVSNSNEPQWRNITVKSELPGKLNKLNELSRNLWWAWNTEGKTLFHDLDRDTWRATSENPVKMLQRLSNEKVEAIQKDSAMLARIDSTYELYKEYMKKPLRKDLPSVAYFCMEYGLCNALKIYSGGLGILAGDYVKEASDRCVNMTAVGFLYRYGYFTQTLSMDGQQIANYEAQNFHQLPIEPVLDKDGRQLVHEVPYPGRTIYANVWKANVGRVTLYLLDTDLDLNSEYDREITHKLYGGDWENRIKQEYLLGIGGVLLLKRLGIKADIYHCNEGHAALLNLQRLADYVQDDGLNISEALEIVRATSLYTVHTPVPAGHDYFDEELFGKYMGEYPERLGISWQELMDMGRENPGSNERFSMSTFALNTTQESNGVSWLHGEVSKKMFAGLWKGYAPEELHVGYVTNGVHLPSWAASEWKEFYEKLFGPNYYETQTQDETWKKIYEADDEEIWKIRKGLKTKLFNFIKEEVANNLRKKQENPAKIIQAVNALNPDALSLIRRIVEISRMPQFVGKVVFVENYDMDVAKRLVSGCDIWMNTPTRPLEASGTSGEKAIMNGTLNLSVLDGWWYEGYKEGAGWALTDKRTFQNQSLQDQLDAETIYTMLETEIVPLYFAKNRKGYSPDWVKAVKDCLYKITPHFTMRRQLDDYYDRFYTKEGARARKLAANDYKLAKEIAAWKARVAENWDTIEVKEFVLPQEDLAAGLSIGKSYTATVVVDGKEIADDLGLDLVIASSGDGAARNTKSFEMEAVKREGTLVTFKIDFPVKYSGAYKIGFRLFPKNANLPHRMDFAYTRWF